MMTHKARIIWSKQVNDLFTDNRYSREHKWVFDSGMEVSASSSPHVVPTPMSSEHAVDPEEAFVASIASCHMLWFLSLAAKHGFIVEIYEDNAEGTMGRNEGGLLAMTSVTLRPQIIFGGVLTPNPKQVENLHQKAHQNCYIASSIKTQVHILNHKTERRESGV